MFNLATVYELCTERSRAKKMQLAERVAERMVEFGAGDGEESEDGEAGREGKKKRWVERRNADFKL